MNGSRVGAAVRSARALCVVLLVALAVLRIADPPPLEELRAASLRHYQVFRPREVTQRPVVIVDIDEASLRKLGQWPWPRTLIADLMTQTDRRWARAHRLRRRFSRARPYVAGNRGRGLSQSRRRDAGQVARAAQQRRRLCRRHAPLACRARRNPAWDSGRSRRTRRRPGSRCLGASAALLYEFPGLLRDVPALEKAASGRGLVTIRTERDGIMRRAPMVMVTQGLLMPTLTLEMLRVVSGARPSWCAPTRPASRASPCPGFVIPTDRNGQLWVHFAPHDPARYVSTADILDGTVAGGPLPQQAGAGRHVGSGPARHQDDARSTR